MLIWIVVGVLAVAVIAQTIWLLVLNWEVSSAHENIGHIHRVLRYMKNPGTGPGGGAI